VRRQGPPEVGRGLILVGSLALVGCTGADAETDQPVIVAPTIIVGDLAAEVAGDEAIVEREHGGV
jgi:ABC-type Zn uptake system ZnuABC Zn-binding protein ZnuA